MASGNASVTSAGVKAVRILLPTAIPKERKEEILRAYQERSSLRGLKRTFGVSPTMVIGWLKKSSRP